MRQLFAGKRVLELGAGQGLVTCCIHRLLCPAQFTATEYVPEVLDQLRMNLIYNGCQAEQVKTMLFDWDRAPEFPELQNQFDVVVGSDVIWDEQASDAVLKAARYLLVPSGLLLLSFVARSTYLREYLERTRELKLEYSTLLDHGQNGQEVLIYLFRHTQ